MNKGVPDAAVLAYATENNRAVVTFDRLDYLNLHKQTPEHGGIIACTYDPDRQGLATRIHEVILKEEEDLKNKFLRIYRPQG